MSVTTTATSTPSRSRNPLRSASADASGSAGSSASSSPATLDASIPDAACTMPRWFSVISVRARRARMRTDSSNTSLRRIRSRSSGSVGTRTSRPSTLDTILLVTTTTSPERSHRAAVGDRAGQVVARAELRQPVDGQDLEPRRRSGQSTDTPASENAARTISAVASTSDISSGTARTSTSGTTAGSPVCTSQPSSSPSADARREP